MGNIGITYLMNIMEIEITNKNRGYLMSIKKVKNDDCVLMYVPKTLELRMCDNE
jgi:hypothetical protein